MKTFLKVTVAVVCLAGCASETTQIEGIRFSLATPSNEIGNRLFDDLQDEIAMCVRREGFEYLREDLRQMSRVSSPFENPNPVDRREKGFGIAIGMLSGPPEYVLNRPAQSPEYQAAVSRCPAREKSAYTEYGKIWAGLNDEMVEAFAAAEATDQFNRFSKKYRSCMSGEGFPGLRDQYAAYRLVEQGLVGVTDVAAGLAVELPIAVADVKCATKFKDLYQAALDEGGREFVQSNIAELRRVEALTDLANNAGSE